MDSASFILESVMSDHIHRSLGKRDRANENFRRASENIMWRCDEIRQRYGADAYILLRRGHRYYEYNSADRMLSLLPSMGLASSPYSSGLLVVNRFTGKYVPRAYCAEEDAFGLYSTKTPTPPAKS